MDLIRNIKEIQERSDGLRRAGNIIGFVPTMGFLHRGHLELMRLAKEHCDRLIVSIFVNPAQFGPTEDYSQYPRDIQGDLEKARDSQVDVVFIPETEEIYPEDFQTEVSVREVSRYLCGKNRPGHFAGVATVVAKLFNITKPHIAIFGQKDFQQLQVIRRMVMDLNMDIRIIGAPIVREPDGLAMSSRNAYLNREERESALCLSKSIALADSMFKQGVRDAGVVKAAIEALIQTHPFTRIDYIALCDSLTLEDTDTLKDNSLLALAVRVGRTRLIDNCLFSEA